MDNIMQATMRVDADGDKIWRLPCGRWHREDGPAIEWKNGDKFWYLNDKLHRTDGPAVVRSNWRNNTWWLNDRVFSFDAWLEANTELTDEQQVMLKLQYG
jgi:hypothetical protein